MRVYSCESLQNDESLMSIEARKWHSLLGQVLDQRFGSIEPNFTNACQNF